MVIEEIRFRGESRCLRLRAAVAFNEELGNPADTAKPAAKKKSRR
jgi:hypothetical protein